MTVRSAGRRARLPGLGCPRFGEIPGSSWLSLHADAAREALADAGMIKADIDGIICASSLVEPHLMPSSVVAEYLGLRPAWSAALMLGGATGCAAVMQAALGGEGGRGRPGLGGGGGGGARGGGRAPPPGPPAGAPGPPPCGRPGPRGGGPGGGGPAAGRG